jgi:hypothetical protein
MNDSLQTEEKPAVLCPGCGVEARDGSEFCYNCGGKLSADAGAVSSEEPLSNNGFRAVGPGAVTKGRERRRRPKPISNDPIQVRWQRDEDPGIRFLIVSVIMGLIALLLIGLGFYLR